MPIDTSMYQSLRPVQINSALDSQAKAQNLATGQMQQMRMGQQMNREDEEHELLKKTQKAVEFGTALDAFVGMPPEERNAKYSKFRADMLASGVTTPDVLTEQYDEGNLRTLYSRWSNSKDGLQNRLTQATIKQKEAEAAAAGPMAQLEVDWKKSQIAKNKAEIAQSGKPKTSPDQFKVAGFVKRAEQAEDSLGQLLKNGYDPTTISADMQSRFFYPEMKKSGEYKGFEQASRNFISAVLRRESGAAISDSEYENEKKKYFPMPGDDADVLAQKAAARQQAMAGLKAEAGAAYDLVPTVAAPTRSKKTEGGLIETAQADAPEVKAPNKLTRVVGGVTYVKVEGGWKKAKP